MALLGTSSFFSGSGLNARMDHDRAICASHADNEACRGSASAIEVCERPVSDKRRDRRPSTVNIHSDDPRPVVPQYLIDCPDKGSPVGETRLVDVLTSIAPVRLARLLAKHGPTAVILTASERSQPISYGPLGAFRLGCAAPDEDQREQQGDRSCRPQSHPANRQYRSFCPISSRSARDRPTCSMERSTSHTSG